MHNELLWIFTQLPDDYIVIDTETTGLPELRVHGLDGLWAVATSVFSTVGGTSPGLGLLQLALRAADDIVGSVADELGITPKSR